jgi:hypothetical protein
MTKLREVLEKLLREHIPKIGRTPKVILGDKIDQAHSQIKQIMLDAVGEDREGNVWVQDGYDEHIGYYKCNEIDGSYNQRGAEIRERIEKL